MTTGTREHSIEKSCLALVAAGIALCVVVKSGVALSFSTDLAGVEEASWYNFYKVITYGNLYRFTPAEFPYTTTPHTPVYYYLIAGLYKFFVSAPVTDIRDIYLFGRYFSLLFVFSAMWLVYLSLIRLATPAFVAGCLVLITLASLDNHVFSMRPDCLKLLLSCAYLYWTASYLADPRLWKGVVMAVVVVLSFFVKQDGILIASAGAILFLLLRHYRVFLVYSVTAGALLLLGNYWMYLRFPNYFSNIVFSVAEFSEYTYFIKILVFYLKTKPHYLLALILLFFARRSSYWKQGRPLVVSAVLLFFVSLAISNKWGSSLAYFTDFQLLVTLSAAVLLPGMEDRRKQAVVLGIACMVSLWGFTRSNWPYIRNWHADRIAFEYKHGLGDHIRQQFKTSPGEYYYCLDPTLNIFLPENQLLGAIHTNDIWVYAKYKYKTGNRVSIPFGAEGFMGYLNSTRVKYVVLNNDSYVLDRFQEFYTFRHREVYRDKHYVVFQNYE